jgi:hypothetical protein
VRSAPAILALLLAAAARAGDNDLQLWRLGHPDAITVCTKCDGSALDRVVEPGDPAAQARFARFTAALGLSLVPSMFEPAATTGQAGFEVGFSGKVAFPRVSASEWPTAGTQGGGAPPKALFLPTLTVRKGLGGSLELGTAATFLAGSQMVALSGELRWALVEGLDYWPDLGIRLYGTRAVGTQELDLVVAGADVAISKSFAIAGVLRLQPYAQYGMALINATSGVIDFHPSSEDVRDPTADDSVFRTVSMLKNRYHRWVLGLRLVSGVAVVGAEGSVAYGTNAVQSDPNPDNTAPAGQRTLLWSASGRLGLSF